ncbi:MAG: PfkB family carbohydrate kinase, partial [Candidatus Ornithospirochaeta sp.]
LFIKGKRDLIASSDILVLDANLGDETILEAASSVSCLVVAEAVSTIKASRLVPSYPYIDILKSNRMELEFLSGIEVEDQSSLRKAASVLIEKGVGAILVTCGTSGAYYVSNNRFIRAGIRKVDVANTNGAGDAFLGGFVAAVGEDMDEFDAMRIASAAASLASSSLETVPRGMNMEIVKEISKETKVEELS